MSPTQLGIPYSRPRYFAVMKCSADGATAQFALQVVAYAPAHTLTVSGNVAVLVLLCCMFLLQKCKSVQVT